MQETKQEIEPELENGRDSEQIFISTAEILRDYTLANESRHASLIGRREVLSGKAKFGIFGDGKEVAQLAMAKAFKKGDFRAGYYRDQTFMFASGAATIKQFFAQLYAIADVAIEPQSAGRQMNAHFATRSLDENGRWRDLTQQLNSSSDISPTGSQMPRLVGLGYASRLYRELDELKHLTQFSRNGNEVAFGTIGNASCAEGMFWEAINAIGVLQAPVVLSIWDDGYGISVPNEYQHTKTNLSDLLSGFQREPNSNRGFDIYSVKGWDYMSLVETYQKATRNARRDHTPAIIHVIEMTQPQGHSTSGSHERYKSDERLAFEETYDCIRKMREWIIEQRIATAGELDQIERNTRKSVENIRTKLWKNFSLPIYKERQEVANIIEEIEAASPRKTELASLRRKLMERKSPFRRDNMEAIQEALLLVRDEQTPAIQKLAQWRTNQLAISKERYGSHLYSQSSESYQNVAEIKPVYSPTPTSLKGYEVLNRAFDAILARDPRVIAFGEDVGQLGGVNQSMAGMQAKYGKLRVSDTGIREVTILGQAIGLAMRGLRPLAEIQYLDYLPYALQIMSDDLATVQWRTRGGQKAPVIVRTRGHRLEGVWHGGSPMGAIVHLLRGMHILVPRNMVQAVGFYNTLLQTDEPGLVVEVLSGYRLKEEVPENLTEFTIPLGVPELVREGEEETVFRFALDESGDLVPGSVHNLQRQIRSLKKS